MNTEIETEIESKNIDNDPFFSIQRCTQEDVNKRKFYPDTWKEEARKSLLKFGAIVYRSFDINSIEDFENFILSQSDENPWMTYSGERASPRSHLGSNTYTSTEYNASGSIFVHNEMCNRSSWPLRLYFGCETPASEGGQTPVCNIRNVTKTIPSEIKEIFNAKKIKYTRNYGNKFGVSIKYGFGTEDRDEVDAYCTKNGISTEWKSDGSLRTTAIRPAMMKHPYTGEKLWFNYATFYSVGSQEKRFQFLLKNIKEDERAFSVRFGDGGEIPESMFDITRAAYRNSTRLFNWERGDILVVDNMLSAHGRNPFKGERSVWVSMTEEYRNNKPQKCLQPQSVESI